MRYDLYCHPIWVACPDCGAERDVPCNVDIRRYTEFHPGRHELCLNTMLWAQRTKPSRDTTITAHREFDVREAKQLREWLASHGDVLYTQTLKGETDGRPSQRTDGSSPDSSAEDSDPTTTAARATDTG